ncbi:MAG: translation elongation factor Ts [Lactobacillus sp.]|jgi:elongation factor Ts|uniref:Elongation factor Ts n=1 Tax=Lacticaseibacillus suilingensis TaxID=2799577 RepID=A0ABW4BHD3_9LACO|nr:MULTISPECIES: translation elongation factor Ts [Lacticaseibacillus]MCI1894995.1 translation elongation factor Ts [Lactobacillus sp.]MCI1940744.1 translation elongation factor Ts [Lactobacillus sp.]MCI1971430.1 translation elongation factor Ts [Lactobacillus sp.]MCI2016483.1 translation elongation factor Ts [Lactobacillus sp.]MCI2038232.1 translation elongation factor Ts [Lactobacillus sp.]
MAITAKQVKELRDRTQVGMMDAKKALVAADGDMEKAIDVLREKGLAKAAKKSGNIAAEGLTAITVDGNTAAIIEVNSETDFVASNDKFQNFVQAAGAAIVAGKPADLTAALALDVDGQSLDDAAKALTAVIGEKIDLRRFTVVEKEDGDHFGAYLHNGGQIAALVTLAGGDDETARDIAMHVAAINPTYLDRSEVPADELKKQTDIFTKETLDEGKPEKIVPRIVEGRVNKWLSESSLVDQEYVKDPDQTVAQFAKSKGATVKGFVRYEVGEGIEKKQDNFVDEVMGQIKD